MEGRLEEESNRINVYLDSSTRKALISTVERVVISNHVDTVVGAGLDQLLDETRHADLSRMFELLERVDALKNLRAAWNTYIKNRGKAIIIDKSRDKQIVEDVLTFKTRIDEILANSFHKNDDFAYALKEGFEAFMKERTDAMPNLVSSYIHKKLQSGNKITSDMELEQLLDRVINIFRFLPSKDKFETCYTRHLSKRLLFGKSASADSEKLMISKLKSECGAQFTQKIEKMMNDMETSRELNSDFKDQRGEELKADMNVLVLTHGSWPEEPFKPIAGLRLPAILTAQQELFEKFYVGKHSGRKLTFLHHRSTCTVRATFNPKSRKEITASLAQASVLMLFNETDSMSFQEIVDAIGITDVEEIKRILQSLACLKFKVLNKEPKGKDVATSDTFAWASGFTFKLTKIKLNQLQMKDTAEEEKKIEEETAENRKFAIQAAVVRIMKARKELQHNQLISEVLSQLRFPIKSVAIKKEIETLIERDYLKRKEDDQNLYSYVA
jgi:cullin 4